MESEKKPKGLANVNQTCYVNTSIQCLLYCKDFFDYIIGLDFENKNTDCVAYEVQSIMKSLWIDQNHMRPLRFLKFLQKYIKDMRIFEQNDINEFIHLLIDKIHDDVKTELPEMEILKPRTNDYYEKQNYKMQLAWHKSHSKEYSPMIDLFYGQLITQITCKKCSKINHSYEDYSLVNLTLNSNNTLQECLNEYFKDDKLDDWVCDNCKEKTDNEKIVRFWNNPKIFIISLKRFDNQMKKIKKEIDIPYELDISDYTLCRKTPVRYKLQSIGCHQGQVDYGHYYAYCKHPNDTMYVINDVFIRPSDNINLQDAYVLFYTCQ